MSVSPHLGRIPYGAGELQRVYVKHMLLGFFLSVALTLIFLSLLRFVDQEAFNPTSQRIVRIVKYSEIELPRSLSDVEFGLSAYPILQEQTHSSESASLDASVSMTSLRGRAKTFKRNVPSERKIGDGLNTLPGQIGIDKIQTDDKTLHPNDMGNESAPADHRDIAGGSGESREPWRKGGVPIAGKSGEPPSGVDRSGIGSSSKPSVGTTPYGIGSDGTGDGEGGGFSLRWLQGMTRRKLSGELPKYPQGTNISAQVRILTMVRPDGTVRSVQPEQKANPLLEEAAMKAIRFWKFEPLGSSLPQVEQSCIIIFLFKLK